jgi:hypothetical protein
MRKLQILVLAFSLPLCCLPFVALAADSSSLPCALSEGTTNEPACPSTLIHTSGTQSTVYAAARSDRSETVSGAALYPIDADAVEGASIVQRCRYVDNIADISRTPDHSVSFFIPFRSPAEWTAFINNAASADFSLKTCARAETLTIPPDTDPSSPTYCLSPSPDKASISLPYARTSATLGKTASFACKGKCSASDPANCASDWTLYATATFVGLNSDEASPSWSRTALAYSGTPSALVSLGECGDANGSVFTSRPTTNLCKTGTASAVIGGQGTSWMWTCSNSGEEKPTSCSAIWLGAGCYVDTEKMDNILIGRCEAACFNIPVGSNGKTPVIWQAGTQIVIDSGMRTLKFVPDGRFSVTWSGDCSRNSPLCMASLPQGTYTSVATILDTQTGKQYAIPVSAMKGQNLGEIGKNGLKKEYCGR